MTREIFIELSEWILLVILVIESVWYYGVEVSLGVHACFPSLFKPKTVNLQWYQNGEFKKCEGQLTDEQMQLHSDVLYCNAMHHISWALYLAGISIQNFISMRTAWLTLIPGAICYLFVQRAKPCWSLYKAIGIQRRQPAK